MNRRKQLFGDGESTFLSQLEGREMLSAVTLDAGGHLMVDGGVGNDSIQVKMQDTPSGMMTQVKINGGTTVTLAGFVNGVSVKGNSGNDNVNFSILGMTNAIPIQVDGGAGNDRIDLRAYGTFRASTYAFLEGGDGNDTITLSSDMQVYASGGAGNDVIHSLGELIWSPAHSLLGGDGNDVLVNDGQYAHLFGGAGDDVMYGGAFGNYFEGGLGSNIMFGGIGNDSFVHHNGGQDRIWGGDGSDGLQIYQIMASTEIYFDGGFGHDYISAYDLSALMAPKFNLFGYEYSWQLGSGGGGKG